ncbi:imm11 family protein [Hyalangium versicolor]|uniref:imm11 family protein n=1 Tax=Hyalangium versicolor TaxID=2861190 RepID=UPI001CCD9BB7|nr:DUF1629 domain-containing protein [Hyalangium versicolor]
MAEFFILEQEILLPDLPTLGPLPKNIDPLEFLAGKKLSRLPARIDLVLTSDSGAFRPDLITYLLPLFSQRIKEALDAFGIDNIDYCPTRLLSESGKEDLNKYWLANILGAFACVDLEKSDAKPYPLGEGLYKIGSFVINEQKTMGQALFRLAEKPRLIIINEALKERLEQLDLKGVRLRNTREYDGY